MARHVFIKCCGYRLDLTNITVEPVLFLYMFANFLCFPAFQALIYEKVCRHLYNTSLCNELLDNETFKDNHTDIHDEVTSQTSYWILRVNIALLVPSFFVVIIFLGPFGDTWGRKFPVMLPCIGGLLAYLSGLFNAKYMEAPLACLLIGPILNGLCGGYIACMMAVYSYVGHISSTENKMKRVGLLESMIFLSGTVGVFVSGVMLETQGYVATFALLCTCMLLAILYAGFWLENVHAPPSETLSHESRWKSTLRFVIETFYCICTSRRQWTLPAIILQVFALDVLMLCTTGDMDISLLYLREHLGFSQTLYGYVRGLDNFMRGIILIMLLPVVKKFTIVKDLPLAMFGLLSYAAAFVVTGLAQAKWLIFLATVIGMFKGLPAAGLRSTMSSMVSLEEQGRLFGLIAASESIIALFASLLFNVLYPATLDFYPGLCYLLAAGLALLMIPVVGIVHYKASRNTGEIPYLTAEDDTTAIVNGNTNA